MRGDAARREEKRREDEKERTTWVGRERKLGLGEKGNEVIARGEKGGRAGRQKEKAFRMRKGKGTTTTMERRRDGELRLPRAE